MTTKKTLTATDFRPSLTVAALLVRTGVKGQREAAEVIQELQDRLGLKGRQETREHLERLGLKGWAVRLVQRALKAQQGSRVHRVHRAKTARARRRMDRLRKTQGGGTAPSERT